MRLFFPGLDQSSPQRTHFLIFLISTSLNEHSGVASSGSTDFDFDRRTSTEVEEGTAEVARGGKCEDVEDRPTPAGGRVRIEEEDEVERLSCAPR